MFPYFLSFPFSIFPYAPIFLFLPSSSSSRIPLPPIFLFLPYSLFLLSPLFFLPSPSPGPAGKMISEKESVNSSVLRLCPLEPYVPLRIQRSASASYFGNICRWGPPVQQGTAREGRKKTASNLPAASNIYCTLRFEYPIRLSSISLAASIPSLIAQTTSD